MTADPSKAALSVAVFGPVEGGESCFDCGASPEDSHRDYCHVPALIEAVRSEGGRDPQEAVCKCGQPRGATFFKRGQPGVEYHGDGAGHVYEAALAEQGRSDQPDAETELEAARRRFPHDMGGDEGRLAWHRAHPERSQPLDAEVEALWQAYNDAYASSFFGDGDPLRAARRAIESRLASRGEHERTLRDGMVEIRDIAARAFIEVPLNKATGPLGDIYQIADSLMSPESKE